MRLVAISHSSMQNQGEYFDFHLLAMSLLAKAKKETCDLAHT
jgi:hypothetical protein